MGSANNLDSSSSNSLGDSFGNYMLHGIDEIRLPEAISWWPQTLGWKILAALLLLWSCRFLFQQIAKWRANRYRRVALKQLERLEGQGKILTHSMKQLPVLLKATALQAYPRSEVAQLTGDAWLQALDLKIGKPLFATSSGRQLLMIDYQPEECWQLDDQQCEELIGLTRQWIKKHRTNDDGVATDG